MKAERMMIKPGKILEKVVKNKKVNIHCLTDIHLGSKVFDRMLFLKAIDKIKSIEPTNEQQELRKKALIKRIE